MKRKPCRLCGHIHWDREPHIWDDEPKKEKIAMIKSMVPVKSASEIPERCTDISKKAERCTDIRQVGIRWLGRHLSFELQTLPFEVTKGGRVIAVVIKPIVILNQIQFTQSP